MDIIKNIYDNLNKAMLFALLIFFAYATVYITVTRSYYTGLFLATTPLLIVFVIVFTNKPYWTFLLLFVINYYISGLSRYIRGVSPGIAIDLVLMLLIAVLILQSLRKEKLFHLSDAVNVLTFMGLIWFVYCFVQLFNPQSSSPLAWLMNVRGIGVYFFIVPVITSLMLRKYKYLRNIMLIWAVLSLTAVAKALMQKFIGFDFAEYRWLAEGASTTHILYTGVRYFSFFTDAANFGSGMGFTSIVFLITAFHIKGWRLKIFYTLTAAGCFYCMVISGTRGSLVIPFLGMLYYTILSKNIKSIAVTVFILTFAFGFLKFTYIGHGNQYIRRMRSVFNEEDSSFQARRENQKILRVLMKEIPFGIGVGMMRGKAVAYRPHPVLSQIAHDSWYVLIWVELGIIGLVLYLFIIFYILLHGSYLVLFKLKNKELRGIVAGILCGLLGLYAAAYTLEIFGQFPNAFIIFICMTFVFLSPVYDKELEEKQNELDEATT